MHIEGQFAHSVDTIDGLIVHRRVDDGSGRLERNIPAADRAVDKHAVPEPAAAMPLFDFSTDASHAAAGEAGKVSSNKSDQRDQIVASVPAVGAEVKTVHARSVMLSSERLGVIAKMDLIEATGNRVTPVDYKRGRPRYDSDGGLSAWPPERVQIALQVLVLRDNGYECDGGVLYFNQTRQRVAVPIDEALLDLTRQAVRGARALTREPQLPPPLVDSPKCPRCSLVNICLPEETRRLVSVQMSSSAVGDPALRVRPLTTARDTRRPLYLNTQGVRVGRQGEVLQVRQDKKLLQEVRLREINQISLLGNVQITTQTVQTLLDLGIPLLYFTMGGWFYGATHSLGHKNILVRREQFRAADRPEICLALARSLVEGKIRNQRTLLMRNHRQPPADVLKQLQRFRERTKRANSLASLLGIEGSAARLYFQAFTGMLKVDCQVVCEGAALPSERPVFDFRGRNRRPPRDPVNALLSFAYSLLTKDCMVACAATGLDPHLGFYHQVKPGKPALALDMMEPFRPLIGDSSVLSALNNRMVTPAHFIDAGQSVVLSGEGRKHFLHAYEQRMDQLVTHPLFDYRVTYRRLLEIQTRLLARRLTGELEDFPVFTTR